MLGNDKLIVLSNSDFSSSMMKSLLNCYRPLIGNDALLLYLSFINLNGEKRVNEYLELLDLTINHFEECLVKLNQYNLVRTLKKANLYVLQVLMPLSIELFLKHDIYSRILRKELGQEAYYRRKEEASNIDLSSFEDISEHLDLAILKDWNPKMEEDIHAESINTNSFNHLFDIKKFLSDTGTYLFPSIARTKENIEEIATLADTYGISQDNMRIYIAESIDNDDLSLKKLAALCRNSVDNYIAVKDGDYYVPVTSFLYHLQGDIELTPYDKKILESLSHDYNLKAEVINVLLEYSLKRCNNRLAGNFVYAVASNFHRNGIDTVAKAKDALTPAKENKVNKKVTEVLPTYDSSINPQLDDDEVNEFFKRRKG